tara:strand:- start:92 stop:694 length:603 start_codon:yes stop_codon:yes gene_type:complete
MGKLGEFEEEEFTILRPEPPSPEGGDGPDGEDPEDQPEGNPETLTEEEIDNIIEDAKSNGFDGIDEDGVIDEDDDLTPEPDEDEEEEKGGEDGEEEEKGGEDGEEEEKGGKEGEDEEKGGEDLEPKEGDFTAKEQETEEDEQRRLKVRYAQLMSKMQNSQKSLADMVNKYGKKIPERIKNGMSETAENMQGLKEITVYED